MHKDLRLSFVLARHLKWLRPYPLIELRMETQPSDVPLHPQRPSKFSSTRRINMTRLRKIVTSGILVLSFVTISYGGTITGSRTSAAPSKVGTITGSRTGTITGSRTGTITGSRTGTITGSRGGTITGSAVGSLSPTVDNIYTEFLFRFLTVVLNGGW